MTVAATADSRLDDRPSADKGRTRILSMHTASGLGAAAYRRSMDDRIGFLGLGIMGRPMAANLDAAGVPLPVWNRSQPALDELIALGTSAAASVEDLFADSDVVIAMLGNESAIDGTLDRASGGIGRLFSGRVLVNMGTVSPGYSAMLAAEVRAAGGALVEAPVSGSRIPAE